MSSAFKTKLTSFLNKINNHKSNLLNKIQDLRNNTKVIKLIIKIEEKKKNKNNYLKTLSVIILYQDLVDK